MAGDPPAALLRGQQLLEAGRLDEADAALLSVDRGGPFYRSACVLLARSARRRGELPFRVDHYLSDFVRLAPSRVGEVEAFEALEALYRAQGLLELAGEIATMLGHDDATLPETPAAALPPLPSLPSLPSEPPAARPAAAAAPVGDRPITLDPSFLTPLAPPAGAPLSPGAADPAAREAATLAVPEPQAAAPHDREAPTLLGPEASPVDETSGGVFTRTPSPGQVSPPNRGGAYAPGRVLAGRYTIEDRLGQGGMATVFRVLDGELDEKVALKLFHADRTGIELLARFKQELRVARRLRHPNIVQLFDLGTEGEDYFLTMELLEGRDLAALIQAGRRRPFKVASAVRWLQAACAGLHAAHAHGVIHRDIKPGNLFVSRDGHLKVMDFGIAKASAVSADFAHTQTGMVLGTPQYMAPEQATDATSVSSATDVYALGVVAFELLTGRRPFDGGGVMAVMLAHLQKPPPSMRELNPRLPEELEAVVLRALAKDPADRFATCQAFAEALQPWAAPSAR